jgi:putative selenium metabolism hydrolase
MYLEAAGELEADLTAFLQDLIRIPSLSSEEGAVIGRIRQEMELLGFDEAVVDPMGNLLGRIGTGPRIIALDGHVDTVDIGDAAQWDRDPLSGDVSDGILYGRGASDMKGGVAASVYAGALLKQLGMPADVTLYVTATVQEEDCDGLCWQYIVNEDGLRPELVVITEPTSLRIHKGQRGRMEMEVTTTGISCHGSAPERGENAIYRMAPIIADIERLNDSLPPREPLGKGSVTISHIRSTAPSLCAVADGCTIHLDRRLTVGETEDTAVAEILSLPSVQACGASVRVPEYAVPSHTGLIYPTRKYYPAWQLATTRPCKPPRPPTSRPSANLRRPVTGRSARTAWRQPACTAYRPSASVPGTSISPMHPTSRPRWTTWCAAPLSMPPSFTFMRKPPEPEPHEQHTNRVDRSDERPGLADDPGLDRRRNRAGAGHRHAAQAGFQERRHHPVPAPQDHLPDLLRQVHAHPQLVRGRDHAAGRACPFH